MTERPRMVSSALRYAARGFSRRAPPHRWRARSGHVRVWMWFLVLLVAEHVLAGLQSLGPPTPAPTPLFQARDAKLRWRVSPEISPHRQEQVQRACGEIFVRMAPPVRESEFQLRQAKDAQDFAEQTGRPAFEAAAVRHLTLWLQPETILAQQQDVEAIVRHECVHLWFRVHHRTALPFLLEEVLALGLSGQAARIAPAPALHGDECEQAERARAHPSSRTSYEAWMSRAVSTYWRNLSQLSVAELRDWLQSPEHAPASASGSPVTSPASDATSSCERILRYLPRGGVKK